jgi:FkbM family methyltransferase
MFELYGVDAIFDIGANIGMSAESYRAAGFRGPIVSFEPVPSLYAELKRRSQADQLWHTVPLALGSQCGHAEIHVTGGHAGATSLLQMTDNVVKHAPDQAVVDTQRIELSTVDDVMAEHYPDGDRLFLKIDVQGYERQVLEGAQQSLPRIVGMKLELSLVENYLGETLLTEMLPMLYDLGYRAVCIERAWGNDSTQEIFQVDVTCFRVERARSPREAWNGR